MHGDELDDAALHCDALVGAELCLIALFCALDALIDAHSRCIEDPATDSRFDALPVSTMVLRPRCLTTICDTVVGTGIRFHVGPRCNPLAKVRSLSITIKRAEARVYWPSKYLLHNLFAADFI